MLELFKIVGKIALEGQDAVTSGLTDIDSEAQKTTSRLVKLGDRFQDVGRKVSSVGGSMTKWVTGPLAAATAGVALLANKASTYTRDLDRMAQVSNTTTREFQKQAFAAQSVGIESDKYADNLKDMNDRVGDFVANGAGPMADFFENIGPKVGVTADQFRGLSGPDALQLYVSSLEKANLSQAEMTFYMEAIAGDSAALVPLLINDGKAMKEFGDEAERSGLILSEDTLQATRDARGEMAKLKQAFEIVTVQIGAALIPVLTELTPILINVVVPAAKALAEVISAMAAGFNALPEPIQAIVVGAIGLAGALGPVLMIAGKVIGVIGMLTKAFAAVKVAALALTPALAPIIVSMAPIIAVVTAVIAVGYALGVAIGALIEHLGGWDAAMQKTKELVATVWEAIKAAFTQGVQFLQQTIQQIIQFFAQMPAQVMAYVKQMVDGVIQFFVNMANGALNAVKNMVSNVVNYVKNMAANVIASIKSMFNAVVGNSIVPDMVRGVLDEFSNMTDGAVKDTQNLVKGVNSELGALPTDINPSVAVANGGRGQGANTGRNNGPTIVDMRHAVIRDDKDMLDRMRRSGLEMTGAF